MPPCTARLRFASPEGLAAPAPDGDDRESGERQNDSRRLGRLAERLRLWTLYVLPGDDVAGRDDQGLVVLALEEELESADTGRVAPEHERVDGIAVRQGEARTEREELLPVLIIDLTGIERRGVQRGCGVGVDVRQRP